MIQTRHIAVLMLTVSCSISAIFGCKAADHKTTQPEPTSQKVTQTSIYDNSAAFQKLKDRLNELEIASVSIIGVDDMIGKNADRERQVYQAILQELTNVDELKVVEADKKELERFFQEKNVNPSRGLSTDASINLAILLGVDAIIYGTIESNECDVNIKVYSAKDGGVIYSETVENLKLPIDKRKDKFEIPPGLLEPENQTES